MMDLLMNALTLPDIAAQASRQSLLLDWVGMCGIAIPVILDGQRLTASADAGVSLDNAEARGIHMSRLYLALEMLAGREPSDIRELWPIELILRETSRPAPKEKAE